ncbi:AAA domain-containing protein [Allokutzneria sp. A3M-2-11 16]|uniref:DEAD/DEAH box helicase n=1 Tax=Allokutzneria sp. A3M-2-11 16 TaxID=2962043 RepID=UPI0020B70EF3|nr:AAA domain-containing protein [Allokutzneria sp. A3M-2-11 16]MCP3802075.1 AAA domain-containing protein [Allokutzneria sp. A3M-2-11 16]
MNGEVELDLAAPIALVPTSKSQQRVLRLRREHPHMPDLAEVQSDLRQRTACGGVLAAIHPDRPDLLVIYSERYFLWLRPNTHVDVYEIIHLDRLRYSDHTLVIKRAMRLRPPTWTILGRRGDPARQGHRTHWAEISNAWKNVAVEPTSQTELITPEQNKFLRTVENLIKADEEIQVAETRSAPRILYRGVRAAREERHSAHGVYVFALSHPSALARKTQVQPSGMTGYRGTVIRQDESDLTVRFDQIIDFDKLPKQGHLEVVSSTIITQTQLRAVNALRSANAINTTLLGSLVDGKFRSFTPDQTVRPSIQLDDDQFTALARARAVPDLMLVMGPPGTGKTRTITEIARSCAGGHEQVLVSAHTHKAVDNVVEGLPEDVLTVRVGNEIHMTEFARTRTVGPQTASLQKQLAAEVDRDSSHLMSFKAHFEVVKECWTRLREQLPKTFHAHENAASQAVSLRAATAHFEAPLRAQVDALHRRVEGSASLLRRREEVLLHHRALTQQATIRASKGHLFAWANRWSARRHYKRAESAFPPYQEAFHDHGRLSAQLGQVWQALQQLPRTHPELLRLTDACAEARKQLDRALDELAAIWSALDRIVRHVQPHPRPIREDLTQWEEYARWCNTTFPALCAKAELLSDWRDQLDKPTYELQPELIRYADVIAATCIGVATSDLIKELNFDLAIIDEAGQAPLPSVLVPLVRSRRAILVGDHKQLPPVLKSEVQELVAKRMGELPREITSSAFESLFSVAPESNQLMLSVQRRMPRVIADFVSAQFYEGKLRTGVERVHRDPLFGSALAVVDTSDLPYAERRESPVRGLAAIGAPPKAQGYRNRAEAKLVTALIADATRRDAEWSVITPYNGQVELIRKLLVEEIGDENRVVDNVGTVDAFQGGERDLIIYSCTRSNTRGKVGFLSELRRFNVAITRAKSQLVLVGDFSTLANADDDSFRALISSLLEHVRQHGERHASCALRSRLDEQL